jgi:hypothetical protein
VKTSFLIALPGALLAKALWADTAAKQAGQAYLLPLDFAAKERLRNAIKNPDTDRPTRARIPDLSNASQNPHAAGFPQPVPLNQTQTIKLVSLDNQYATSAAR